MNELFGIMVLPFWACLILTGIHAYLGLHVIERQVIFVDLALAQIAVLGAGAALLAGYDFGTGPNYVISLLFTVAGAAVFAAARHREQKIPQEAVIGITYVVAAALLVIILNFSGEGLEHIRESLVGNILLVTPLKVFKILIIYGVVGILHYVFRKPFFLISRDPQKAFAQGLNVRGWDFLFYMLFGVVVTSSVEIAGVLLVFSYLVIPAVMAILFTDTLRTRLLLGWGFGTLGSVLGMAASAVYDLPTGASIVVAFGGLLMAAASFKAMLIFLAKADERRHNRTYSLRG